MRNGADIPTMAVGLLSDVAAAEAILEQGDADFIAVARGALDDPNWPAHAASQLGDTSYELYPVQARRVREHDKAMGLHGFAPST